MAIKNLGLTETVIDTWATACWVRNSVHLISDSGGYERFFLKDGKVAPAGKLAIPNPPSAICQGQSKLWSLSEKEGTISAAEISWDDSRNPTQ